MTPIFSIELDGEDITQRIQTRLLSLRIIDKAGKESDSVELSLDDSNHVIALPTTGVKLTVSLGYKETTQSKMGTYVVDEIELSGPPSSINIRAKAADMGGSLKSQRDYSWKDKTIKQVVDEIAKRHDLTAKVSPALQSIHCNHINQTNESDINFLSRLAQQFGAIAKPAEGYLLFIQQGESTSVSGQSLKVLDLIPGQVMNWRVTLADRQKFNSVAAHYYDLDKAERVKVVAGNEVDSEPERVLQGDFCNKQTAEKAADAEFNRLLRSQGTLSLNLLGDPSLLAETPLNLSQFREGVDGKWVVTQAQHEFSNSGYIVRLDAERV